MEWLAIAARRDTSNAEIGEELLTLSFLRAGGLR
jgi:hypothetical protein